MRRRRGSNLYGYAVSALGREPYEEVRRRDGRNRSIKGTNLEMIQHTIHGPFCIPFGAMSAHQIVEGSQSVRWANACELPLCDHFHYLQRLNDVWLPIPENVHKDVNIQSYGHIYFFSRY